MTPVRMTNISRRTWWCTLRYLPSPGQTLFSGASIYKRGSRASWAVKNSGVGAVMFFAATSRAVAWGSRSGRDLTGHGSRSLDLPRETPPQQIKHVLVFSYFVPEASTKPSINDYRTSIQKTQERGEAPNFCESSKEPACTRRRRDCDSWNGYSQCKLLLF